MDDKMRGCLARSVKASHQILTVLMLLCLFPFGSSPSQKPAKKPLNNQDIIKMASAGLGEDTIIRTIEANETAFDISADAVIALKNAGVGEKAMIAMIAATKQGDTRTAKAFEMKPPKPPPRQTSLPPTPPDIRTPAPEILKTPMNLEDDQSQSQTQTLTIPAGPGTPCIASALDPSVQADAAKKMVIGVNRSPGVSPKDFAFTACVVEKLLRNRFTVPTFRWFISYVSEANAIAYAQRNDIVIYSGLLTFLNYNEDELAAVIAHEIGHLLDYRTPAVAGQLKCIEGTRVSAWEHQACEARADDFGLQYLLGAGYSGYGMAGFLGRVLVHQGDTGLKGFVLRFTSSHPVNIERLKAVRARWIELCQQRSLACQNTGQ